MSYKVAIITRTKDRQVLLPRAVLSVINQTYSDWIHVIVNDGGCSEVVEQSVAAHRKAYGDRLKILHHKESMGMQSASNAGIAACESTYLVIHDDDDSWAPGYLEACVGYLKSAGPQSRYQGVIAHTERIYEETDNHGQPIEKYREDHIPLDQVSLFRAGFENPFAPIAFLFRRTAYEAVGPFNQDYTVLGDWDFHYRFLQQFEIGVVPEKLAYYHWRLKSAREEDANTVTAGIEEHKLRLNELSNSYLREDFAKGLSFNLPRLQYKNNELLQVTNNQIETLKQAISDLKDEVQQLQNGVHHAAYMSSRVEAKVKLPHQLAKWIINKYEFILDIFKLNWLPIPSRQSKQAYFQPFAQPQSKAFDREHLKLQVEKAELVIFDVFDTCLHRTVRKPTDLFLLLGARCAEITGLSQQIFAKERIKSEEHARMLTERADITLAEIYDVLIKRNNLELGLKDALMDKEVALEHNSTYANPWILDLFKHVASAGKKILFLSDMYLPEQVIESLLREKGFAAEEVVVSSQIGLTKGSGSLFEYVLKNYGVAPEKILHIDDNYEWAIQPAQKRGIRAYHFSQDLLPKCLAEEAKPERVAEFHEASDSLAFGLSRKRSLELGTYHVEGHTNGTSVLPRKEKAFWENIGYQVAGPLYYFYTQWLIGRAKEQGLRTLVFLSRDGYYLEKTFRLLKERWDLDIDGLYLYSSRRFFNMAAIEEMDLKAKGFLLGPNPNLTLRDYFLRLGLEPDSYNSLIHAHGFSSIDDPVTSAKASFLDEETQDRVHRLFADLTPDILDICSEERDKLKAYLQDNAFDPANSGIVDVGWQASSIQSIDRLTRKLFGTPSRGFYFATWNLANAALEEGCQFESFFTHLGKPWYRGQVLIESVAIIEKFFSAPHPSVVSVQRKEKGWQPVFPKTNDSHLPVEEIYDHLWTGARTFIEDFGEQQPQLSDETGHDYLEAVLERLLHHPTREEAQMLGKLHHRESFGNVQSKAIVPRPAPSLRSTKPLVKELLSAEWRKGYLTLLNDRQRSKIGNYHPYLKKA